MKNDSSRESHLDIDMYKGSSLSKKKWIPITFAASSFFLFLGFFLNFSTADFLKNMISQGLDRYSEKVCPINYSAIDHGYFPPRIIIKNLRIDGRCLGKRNGSLTSETIQFKFYGVNPFSLSAIVSTQFNIGKSKIRIDKAISLNKITIKLHESNIHLSSLQSIEPLFRKIQGSFKLNSTIELEKQKLSSLSYRIESHDFLVAKQSIGFFAIPRLDIGDIVSQGSIDKTNKLTIDNLKIGKESSPLLASLSGKINIDQKDIRQSILDLAVKFKIADPKISQLVPHYLLSQLTKQGSYYHFNLGGKLGQPSLTKL